MNGGSSQDVFHHAAGNVGQPKIAPAVAIRELLVVQSHLVQNRGVQIMHVNGILDHAEAEVVRPAVDEAAFESASRKQHSEAQMIVIAAALYLDVAAGLIDRR